ncbi:hypothetical protein Ade02nite_31830 [Paractinoplanes deccanensis]|uniref:DUF1269 domain-containing family protein n=1 Tax=Paractinoplanes deccanensis TaxID=113561 RepID=A0ABQ3Y3K6_9ACTN|nr:DUF6325 family protein [Actinoplanes deccanensis]GID74542.1 hypothetical protein Ade02nite_31830 [Actinoplanes deccanensis]
MPEVDEMGPIDYLCVEFPAGSMDGTAFPLLVDLVDRHIIRILDIALIRKDADGKVFALEESEFDINGLDAFHGAASGLLDGEDLREAGEVLAPGAAAVLLIYENTWAAPLARRLRLNGAQLVASGRIPVQALLAALDDTEPQYAAKER